jgi:pilus assembly protein CpaE
MPSDLRIGGAPVELHPISPEDPIHRDQLAGLGLAVIEVCPNERRSIERLIQLVNDLPDLSVVAAIRSPDVALVRTLLREGVADVVSLPLDPVELNQVVLEVLARRTRSGARLCPMIAVMKATGGCGATTTATQLLGRLVETDWVGAPPLLVDLDVQSGTAADYLGVEPTGSVLDLLQSSERLDDALIQSIVSSKDGYAVLSAPRDIHPLGAIETENLLKTLQFARLHFGAVLVDLPASWTDWSLSLLTECDAVLMVSELSLHSLRQAKRNLDLLDSVGVPQERIKIVLNRVGKRLFGALRSEDAERVLRCELLANLPLEPELSKGQQAGLLVAEHARKSRYAQELSRLAASVRELIDKKSNR